jgi:DNA-3-methyladenine glycosylase I
MNRCSWVPDDDPLYIKYHDEEWGVPVHDDQKLFEFIVLESAQAGLSWRTILHKREGYRRAFKNFDPKKVARMKDSELELLRSDGSIIRNRLKIYVTRKNALCFLETVKEFGSFQSYLWSWVDGIPVQSKRGTASDIPVVSPLALAIAKDLKKRGFSFLGPTIVYAYLQAVGVVDNHEVRCFKSSHNRSIRKNSDPH